MQEIEDGMSSIVSSVDFQDTILPLLMLADAD